MVACRQCDVPRSLRMGERWCVTGCQVKRLLQVCPSALSPQPWSFLLDKTSHCCHVFSNNAEREALEITAHPQCAIWCLTGKLKGITTKAILTFYINTKHLPTGPSPVAPSSCLHVALLLPLKHFYFIKKPISSSLLHFPLVIPFDAI